MSQVYIGAVDSNEPKTRPSGSAMTLRDNRCRAAPPKIPPAAPQVALLDEFKFGREKPFSLSLAPSAAPAEAMSGIIQDLPQAMKEARQYALLGNYDSASIYFEGSIQQILQYALSLRYADADGHRYLRSVQDPETRAKWLKVKEDLTAEFKIIQDLANELNNFKVFLWLA